MGQSLLFKYLVPGDRVQVVLSNGTALSGIIEALDEKYVVVKSGQKLHLLAVRVLSMVEKMTGEALPVPSSDNDGAGQKKGRYQEASSDNTIALVEEEILFADEALQLQEVYKKKRAFIESSAYLRDAYYNKLRELQSFNRF